MVYKNYCYAKEDDSMCNDLVDDKILALFNYHNKQFDETNDSDIIFYMEVRDFAENHGNLLYFWGNSYYLVINFIGEKDYLIIPTDYSL